MLRHPRALPAQQRNSGPVTRKAVVSAPIAFRLTEVRIDLSAHGKWETTVCKEIIGAFLVFAVLACSMEPSAAQESDCDRQCLIVAMDNFVNEITGNAAPALPLSPGVTLLLYDDGRQMYVSEVFRIIDGKIALIDNIGLMLNPPTDTLGFTH